MQERRHTRRMRHRIRKRVVFAMTFLGFSTLFYQSVQSFDQDRAVAATYIPPVSDTYRLAAAGSISLPVSGTPLQGPVAIGLAFRINGNPGLHAQLARLRHQENVDPVVLPELVSLR